MYKILRNILFLFDAEEVHYFSMNVLKLILKIPLAKKIINNQFSIINSQLERTFFGLQFKNPVGLAAGFDKNAKYLTELETLGFGFIEIGTVTPLPQNGNDKPRLFRLSKDKALINRMGFNNDGVKIIAKRLKEWKDTREKVQDDKTTTNYKLIIGGNIGKNKLTANEDAWKDYKICFEELFDLVDYFVVNISSPNTPGLRELQQKESLRKILSSLQNINLQKEKPKPLLLKISPDLNKEDLDDIIDLANEIKLDGLVVANTSIKREQLQTTNYKLQTIGAGGLSGKPLQKISTDMVDYIYKKTNKELPIIASGGIFKAKDAQEKIASGASLVQVWTGFIYEGPAIVKNILKQI
jgi:dihydroorotate dehydrogenase